MSAIHVIISGRVQGVAYRAWTARTALGLGLGGWVRNRRDGTVEAVFSGDAQSLERMKQALWEGSPAARVKDVAVTEGPEPENPGFQVLPTA